jgi:hypothetical protein
MDKSLEAFQKNNPGAKIVEETEHYNIDNLWNDDTFRARFKKTEDFSSLETIFLYHEFAAIYHKQAKFIEYIFTPLDSQHPLISRKFSIFYKGVEFVAEFSEPSEAFKLIANAFTELKPPSNTNYRNIDRFRNFYKKDTLSASSIKAFYNKKSPVMFKLSGDFDAIDLDLVGFSKNVNFYLEYYDRKSPYILMFEKEPETYSVPCYNTKSGFPETINTKKIDPVLVDLFEVARVTNNNRLCYLFYYQVLEYCAYYYFSQDINGKLTKILKQPDLLMNVSGYGKSIVDLLKPELSIKDEIKVQNLIGEFIVINDIHHELEENIDYFCKDIIFDGDFVIKKLFNSAEELQNQPVGLVKEIKQNIEKIRNVLVHIRESRENKVILPTKRNSNLLIPYLHLVKRIAEKIAIQYE